MKNEKITNVPLRKSEAKILIKALHLLISEEEDVNDYTLIFQKLNLVR